MGNVSVDTSNYATLSRVRVTWDNSDEDPGHTSWRVYRRNNDGAATWLLLYQEDAALTNYTYDDYTCPANVDIDYAVVEVTSGNVEGTYTPVAASPIDDHYWIIDVDDIAKNFRLEHVRKDDFSDEYEEETFLLIGRGRKKDVGTRMGYAGTLQASIKPRSGKTSLQQKQEIEALKISQDTLYIRSPFGDSFKAAIGTLSWQRIAGSGTDAWFDVTIPYEELY